MSAIWSVLFIANQYLIVELLGLVFKVISVSFFHSFSLGSIGTNSFFGSNLTRSTLMDGSLSLRLSQNSENPYDEFNANRGVIDLYWDMKLVGVLG